jgi:hypothetical protein
MLSSDRIGEGAQHPIKGCDVCDAATATRFTDDVQPEYRVRGYLPLEPNAKLVPFARTMVEVGARTVTTAPPYRASSRSRYVVTRYVSLAAVRRWQAPASAY